jgi:phenylpropionate dioxygenase-like ring-hydroxylating dioxygenase large terminal subunit
MTDQLTESSINLRSFWHPVGWASDIGDAPTSTVLLGERLVIWRAGGRPVAARDQCPHRGTALSLGEVSGEHLVCPYHGWRFDAAGEVQSIPQLGADGLIPRRACVETFPCTERYGLIWVALDSPVFDIPEFPEWDDPTYRHVACEAYTWEASAGRMVENFTDFGHLGYLHDGLLGTRDDLVVPAHRVQQVGGKLEYELTMVVPNTDDQFVVTDVSGARGLQTNTYVLSLPYAIHLACRYHDTGSYRTLFFAVQPHGDTTSTGYCYQSRNFDLDKPDAPYADFQALLADQDKPIVESQLPAGLPLEAQAELHLPFDRVAVAYRRALRDLAMAPDDLESLPSTPGPAPAGAT